MSETSSVPSARMPPIAIAAAVLVAMCWGGNFTASKIAMEHFPPYSAIWVRFAIVTLVLAPWGLRKKPNWRDMLVLSFCYITLHFTLLFVALSMGIAISTTVVALQLGVPFSCVMAAIFYNDKLGPWRSFGMMVAFVGVLLIAGTPDVTQHWNAFLLVLAGALAWASANIYTKRLGAIDVVPFLFWPALFALPQVGLLSFIFEHDQWQHVVDAPLNAWLAIGYSTVFSTFVGYGLWYSLLAKYPLSQVTPFSLLVPLAGIAGGVLVYHEPMTTSLIIGGILTLLGVAVITVRRPKLAVLDKL